MCVYQRNDKFIEAIVPRGGSCSTDYLTVCVAAWIIWYVFDRLKQRRSHLFAANVVVLFIISRGEIPMCTIRCNTNWHTEYWVTIHIQIVHICQVWSEVIPQYFVLKFVHIALHFIAYLFKNLHYCILTIQFKINSQFDIFVCDNKKKEKKQNYEKLNLVGH